MHFLAINSYLLKKKKLKCLKLRAAKVTLHGVLRIRKVSHRLLSLGFHWNLKNPCTRSKVWIPHLRAGCSCHLPKTESPYSERGFHCCVGTENGFTEHPLDTSSVSQNNNIFSCSSFIIQPAIAGVRWLANCFNRCKYSLVLAIRWKTWPAVDSLVLEELGLQNTFIWIKTALVMGWCLV